MTEGFNVALQAGNTNAVPPPTFQWYRNNQKLPNATNTTYSLLNAQYNQVGSYSVIVSNFLGAATNQIALLTIQSPLYLTQEFSNNLPLLRIGGSSTQAAVLLFSTNLTVWTPLYTNTSPLYPIEYHDTNGNSRVRGFFRYRSWP